MDGVLTNFKDYYNNLFHGQTDKKFWNKNWKVFTSERHFTKLDWHEGAHELVSYVKSTGIPYEILSSSGGPDYYDDIVEHKTEWLKERGFDCPINIVAGKKFKKHYATPSRMLIDDTESVIEEFNGAGGKGILHISTPNTIMIMEKHI